jgi:hypothetical protein
MSDLPPEVEKLINSLRSFDKAYSEDFFPPLSETEKEKMGSLLDRASASMGRHFAQFAVQAADMLEKYASGKNPGLPPMTDAEVVEAAQRADVANGGIVLVQKTESDKMVPTFSARVFVDVLVEIAANSAARRAALPQTHIVGQQDFNLGAAIAQGLGKKDVDTSEGK